jgi:DNA-binding CsgD family transcriptional regulator
MYHELCPLQTAWADCQPRWPNLHLWRTTFAASLRMAPAALRRAGLEDVRVRELERVVDDWCRRWGVADELWVNAQDPTGVGCCLIAPLRSHPLSKREVHQWRCVAAHVATAFRIRRQLAGWSGSVATTTAPGRAPPVPEAILRPDGKLDHAEEPAQGAPARAALLSSVRALDRARGPLRRRDPDEAVALWQALVAGRWSLLDRFDSDGRRYVVAHRNEVAVPDARGLTLRERQVLAYAAIGHSNKWIAYALGLSTSTVGGHLTRARAKLRLLSDAAAAPPQAADGVGRASSALMHR